MDAVEDGLSRAATDTLAGPLRISALGLLTNHYVVPAALALKDQHPEIRPVVENHRTSEAFRRLMSGQLHVAFTYEPLADQAIVIEQLGVTRASVYCSQAHPLYGRRPTLDELLEHEFSIPAIGDTGVVMDGWPVDVERRVGMQITLLTTNLQVCLDGQMVTVLPDVTALEDARAGRLWRIPFERLAPIAMFACRMATEVRGSAVDLLVSRVRRQVAQLEEEIAEVHRSGPAVTS